MINAFFDIINTYIDDETKFKVTINKEISDSYSIIIYAPNRTYTLPIYLDVEFVELTGVKVDYVYESKNHIC